MQVVDRDVGLTTGQAALHLAVSRDTTKKWARRGWVDPDGVLRSLTQVGVDGRGNRLFRLADWLVAEKHTRRNPNSRRAA